MSDAFSTPAASTPAAPAATAPPTVSTSLAELQNVAAQAAGLPADLASRLQGQGLAELVADARTLAASIAPPTPAEPTPAAAPAAAAATPATPAHDPEDGFDGGTRREQPNGITLDQIRKLGRENPRELNRRLEAGEISLSQVRR
jgi:hypothetical protein